MNAAMGNNNQQTPMPLVITFPGLAFAGEAVFINDLWLSAAIFLIVQALSLLGYAAAKLPEWAVWHDHSGTVVEVAARKLKLLQGVLVSVLAGNLAYYGGDAIIGASTLPLLIGSGVAAYGGDRFLTPILVRITGK